MIAEPERAIGILEACVQSADADVDERRRSALILAGMHRRNQRIMRQAAVLRYAWEELQLPQIGEALASCLEHRLGRRDAALHVAEASLEKLESGLTGIRSRSQLERHRKSLLHRISRLRRKLHLNP